MRRLLLLGLLLISAPATAMDTIARGALVVDLSTNTILLDKAADVRMPPSSMTKIMTLYLTFEALKSGRLKLTDTLPVSRAAREQPGSRMFLEENSRPTIEELIRGTAIQSGNDAAVVLAEGIAGSEAAFAEMMNKKAKEIGLSGSHFVNATGLPDPAHHMTAADLAMLSAALINDFPEYYRYEAELQFTYNGIRQEDRNPLLGKVAGADGMKTGHTELAGYGLVGSAVRDGRRILIVLNGLKSQADRAAESERLINWAYATSQVITLIKPGRELDRLPVWGGTAPDVGAIANNEIKLTVSPEDIKGIRAELTSKLPLIAPVKNGQEVGRIAITVPGKGEHSLPVYATADVPALNFVGRANAATRALIDGDSAAATP